MADLQIKLLQQMPVFGGLKAETLHLIMDASVETEVASGDFFFHEGERGECLYVLESGLVIVEKNWRAQKVEIGRLETGDCFGEMALIDLQRRSASVKADQDCLAIMIPRQALLSLFQQDLEQYAIIMMNMGREVSRRLRELHERLFVLQQEDRFEIEAIKDDLTAKPFLLST